jgi:hypothetical protein
MTVSVRCLAASWDEAQRFEQPLLLDTMIPTSALPALDGVVLQSGSEERARSLLQRGAARVLIGDAALADRTLIARLAGEFGGARVGLFVRARRRPNRWSFDTTSNADFKIVAPSVCEPVWDVLRADGSASGFGAGRWIDAMAACGAATALVQVDIDDDADLNIAAGVVERLGEHACFTPATQATPALYDWMRYAGVRSIALAPRLYARRQSLLQPPEVQTPA